MKTVACVACGQEVAVPDELVGGRGECPLCGARFRVSGESSAPGARDGAVAGVVSSLRARFALPRLTWPLDGPRARRCVGCQRTLFALPGPCPHCGGETAGLEPAAVASGADRGLRDASRDFRRQETILNYAASAIWSVAAALILLLFVEMMGNRYLVVNLLFFALFAAPIVVVAAWLHVRAVDLVATRFACRHAPPPGADPAAPTATALGRLREEVVDPFLDRHRIAEGLPIRAPEEELRMLRQLLARQGLTLDPADLLAFLTSCSLRRNFDRFLWDLEGQPSFDRAPIVAYAAVVTDEAEDATRLPFLRHILAESGRDADEAHVLAVLRDVRRERKLRSFAADLRERRPAPPTTVPAIALAPTGPGLAIARVDAMLPRNFEPLLALIHRARGDAVQEAARAGEAGADLVLERPGERVVLQGHLSNQPIGPQVVQRAVAARLYYRCQRAIVATNHHFTPTAADLAATEGVELVDRRGLIALLDAFNRSPSRDDPRLAPLLAPAG